MISRAVMELDKVFYCAVYGDTNQKLSLNVSMTFIFLRCEICQIYEIYVLIRYVKYIRTLKKNRIIKRYIHVSCI